MRFVDIFKSMWTVRYLIYQEQFIRSQIVMDFLWLRSYFLNEVYPRYINYYSILLLGRECYFVELLRL